MQSHLSGIVACSSDLDFAFLTIDRPVNTASLLIVDCSG